LALITVFNTAACSFKKLEDFGVLPSILQPFLAKASEE
jgi:hypothetical protein